MKLVCLSSLLPRPLLSVLTFFASGCLTAFFMCSAQTPAKKVPSLAPAQLYGKSVAECDKMLGKPKLIEKRNGDTDKKHYYFQYYKVNHPGLTRIILSTSTTTKEPSPQLKIDGIAYEFPKGTKTWQKALVLIGVNTKGVKAEKMTEQGTSFTLSLSAYQFNALWITADDSNPASANPIHGYPPHPDDDYLEFYRVSDPG